MTVAGSKILCIRRYGYGEVTAWLPRVGPVLPLRPSSCTHKKGDSVNTSAPLPSLAASVRGFAGDQVVAFSFGIRLNGGQVRMSICDLSRPHFDFSQRETRIKFDAHITQLSRLRNDGGQFLACCGGGSGVGIAGGGFD